jgi:superfamily II DNA or RNA helicase
VNYQAFLQAKRHEYSMHGFEPLWMPDVMMDFQRSLLQWATLKGRSALFADCGLGKTLIQLAWAENIVRKTNGRVLILAPLAVSDQTVREGEKFGIEAHRSKDGKPNGKIVVTNYQRLHLFDKADFVACVCDESSILKNYDGHYKAQITAMSRE